MTNYSIYLLLCLLELPLLCAGPKTPIYIPSNDKGGLKVMFVDLPENKLSSAAAKPTLAQIHNPLAQRTLTRGMGFVNQTPPPTARRVASDGRRRLYLAPENGRPLTAKTKTQTTGLGSLEKVPPAPAAAKKSSRAVHGNKSAALAE